MERGFVRRAKEVEALMRDPRTAFVVVTTLETAPSYEARFLARSLVDRGMALGAIVANRVLPAALASTAASDSAAALAEASDGDLATAVAGELGVARTTTASVLRQIATRFDDVALVAARESDRRAELADLAPVLLSVPWLAGDIHDLAGLGSLAGHLRNG